MFYAGTYGDSAGGESGFGGPLGEAQAVSGQGASASEHRKLAQGLPHAEQNGRLNGWPQSGAAQKGLGASSSASSEKENAQPNGVASAAAYLRTAPGPGRFTLCGAAHSVWTWLSCLSMNS